MTAKSKGAAEPAGEPPPAQAEPTPQPAGEPKAPASGQTGQTAAQTGFHAVVPPQRHHVEAHPTGKRLGILSLTALGIVYGDIGTSPLYALQQCFTSKEHPIPPTTANVYGILSLIIWLLGLVVSVKYILFIMRADNRGEGGILALLALILQQERRSSDSRRRIILIALGLFGAALLYGDGMITPAISVLGAIEGLNVATHIFEPYIVPITLVILVGLFMIQSHGTARVGLLFGPVMVVW